MNVHEYQGKEILRWCESGAVVGRGARVCAGDTLYLGMVVDRATQRVTLIASSEGGTEIEVGGCPLARAYSQSGGGSG